MNDQSDNQDFCLNPEDDVLATLTSDGKRRWIYPRVARGFWLQRRTVLAYLLIVVFVAVPFIRIGGEPLFLVDVINQRLHLFGKPFFATDSALLLFFGLSVVVSIMTVTAYLGRAWCGWACPQTVYLEFVFRPIERWIEGSPAQMSRLDQTPLSLNKFSKKLLKYSIFTVLCFILANTFLSYFVGTDRLILWVTRSPLEHPESFAVVVFVTGLMMFDFCYFREQMCSIACPYARLQSALLDRNSAIVAYDYARGEPRGRGKDRDGKGDCIECGVCQDVCPAGIDIRKGLQLECIHCTQCIDGCDSIMEKIGKPPGLIRYATKASLENEKVRIFRPRTLLYSVVLVGLFSGFLSLASGRTEYEAQVIRDRSAPYSLLSDGRISNHLNIVVRNKSERAEQFILRGVSPLGAEFVIPDNNFTLAGGGSKTVHVFVNLPANERALQGELEVVAGDDYRKLLLFPVSVPQ